MKNAKIKKGKSDHAQLQEALWEQARGTSGLRDSKQKGARAVQGAARKKKTPDPGTITILKLFKQIDQKLNVLLKRTQTILDLLEQSKPQVRFDFKVGPVTTKPKIRNTTTMLEVETTNEQQIKITLSPSTSTGKPAKVDGVPTWEVISGNATVTAAEDGMSAQLISADDPGDTDFLVKADADLGEGYTEISDIIRYHVKGAGAASLGLAAGEVTPK